MSYYKKPCFGYVTSFFEPDRLHPKDGVIRAHHGVDIGSDSDNRVWAAAAGKVVKVGEDDKAGKFVLIAHPNGDTTNYSHLSRIDVAANHLVSQGQRIGMKGDTGSATGVHLHFEIIRGPYTSDFNKKRNPLLHFMDPLTLEMQGQMQELGYAVTRDGYYGQEMIAAVTLYQQRRGLIADGYAGAATHAALKADVAKLVAADAPKAPATSTLTLTFSSGTLRRIVETFIASDAQQKIALRMAAEQEYSPDWQTREKTDGDFVGLLIGSAIKQNKQPVAKKESE